jgi:predicted membrane protein
MAEQQHDDEWWIDHTNLDERTKALLRQRRRRHGSAGSRLFFAIFLIAVGILLFLDNIGLIPVRNIWDYWPLILVAAGLGRLINCRHPQARLIGFFLVLFGALLLLVTLHIVQIHTRDGSWPLALLLIAFGVALLIKVLEPAGIRGQSFGLPAPVADDAINFLNDTAILGAIKRKLETPNFRGGAIFSSFGSVEIDLRRSQISAPERTATLDIRAVFGGAKIRVPENWKVNIIGASILGAYEDKTIPPNTGPNSPTLVVTGFSVFSGIEIEN